MIKRNIPFSPPDIGEEELEEVAETLKSGWITTGPKTKEFERKIAEYCHTDKAVCLNSATACLELILRLLGVGPGDEVIVPAYTYTATASPVCHVGARLVMIDAEKDSYEMNYSLLEEHITEKTKVIIPVDLGGKICDYDRIFSIVNHCKNKFVPANHLQEAIGRIAVVADGAHAFGAMKAGKHSGQFADFTTFSFHAVKNLTTAEGGALTWQKMEEIDSDWIYQQFMLLSLHGQSKDALSKTKTGSWEYDIMSPAYKCNMTDIMASIGLAQMRRYSGMLARRQEIIKKYDSALKPLGIQLMEHYGENWQSSGHLYLTRIPGIKEAERNQILTQLAEQGVAANVHYKPLPMMSAYRHLGFNIENFPNAFSQYQNEITLPLHTKLSDEEVEYIIYVMRKTIKA